MWELFLTFIKVGVVSFGGGYAMIPMIQEEVVMRHGWLSLAQYTDVIAVAGMSPGPIAVNIAVFVGYSELGIRGAVASALGMVTPSLAIILVIGTAFRRFGDNKYVQWAFYGLRPIITGLIVYAAVSFAKNNGLISSASWHMASLIGIYILSLAALLYFRLHPIYVIVISGLAGIALYS